MISSGVHMPASQVMSMLGRDTRLLRAISCKGTTFYAKGGNRPPRLASKGVCMGNSIGLQNPGIQFQLMSLKKFKEEFPDIECWLNLHAPDIPKCLPYIRQAQSYLNTIEINISCPNVGEVDISLNDLEALRNQFGGPLYLKGPPLGLFDVDDPWGALNVIEPHVDGFVISNTLPVQVNLFTDAPFEKYQFGVTGPFLRALNCQTIRKFRNKTKKEIIGCGGIAHISHIEDYLEAGARAVQIGSACLWDPHLPVRLARQWEARYG